MIAPGTEQRSAELLEPAQMTRDQLREEARRMVAKGGLVGRLAAAALAIDARWTWGAGSESKGAH